MKTRYQILLIGLTISALFVARDDFKVAYDHVSGYLTKNINTANIKDNILVETKKIARTVNSINTPGALRATTGLAISAQYVNLSIKEVIDMTNKNRSDNGNLSLLKENPKLDMSADIKLKDMLNQGYFEHISPGGVGVSDLGKQVGYDYIVIGENLALGNFKDSKSLLDAWMASPGHRANILNDKYTEIGVAVGHGVYQGRDTWLAVQHFGVPRSVCPAIDEVLHGLINVQENNVTNMESDLTLRKKKIDSGVVYQGMTTNEQIEQYNKMISSYNQLVTQLKQKISIYNTQVRLFNSCLGNNTVATPSH